MSVISLKVLIGQSTLIIITSIRLTYKHKIVWESNKAIYFHHEDDDQKNCIDKSLTLIYTHQNKVVKL